MFRKWMGILLSFGVVFLTAGTVQAVQTGSLQVIPQWCGEPVAGGVVSLCRVGTEGEKGIQVTDGLANWTLEEGDILSHDWFHWVLQRTQPQILAEVTGEGAVFSGLEEGVYLVQQVESSTGYSGFAPFLQAIPGKQGWRQVRKPFVTNLEESPRTADHPAPIIGAMGIGFSVAVLMVLVDGRKK